MAGISIVPFYPAGLVHAPFFLYAGDFSVKGNDRSRALRGHLEFTWLPRPHVRFEGVTNEPGGLDVLLDPYVDMTRAVALPNLAVIPAPTTTPAVDLPEVGFTTRSSASVGQVLAGSQRARVVEIRFNLINFWVFERGRVVREEPEPIFACEASFGPWELAIQNADAARGTVREVDAIGGYFFTHYCSLFRSDREPFPFADGHDLLNMIFLLVSFVRGRLVAPILPVGFSPSNQPVAAAWESHVVDSWKSCASWFPRHEPSTLSAVFDSAYGRWKDKYWREILVRAIRLYVAANDPNPVDTAIVNAQIGLELLGWAVLVDDEGWLHEGEGRLNAAGRLRLLLKWASIPTDVPDELSRLQQFAKTRGFDGPASVVWIRNRLVHPDRKDLSLDKVVASETWQLALSYYELVLLKVIGYRDQYVDRIRDRWYGKSRLVPWAVGSPE